VGFGPTVKELMNAFIASPGHYKNLVDPTFTHIGVGTVRTQNGMLYTAHEFMALEGSRSPAVTAAPAPVTTTPKVHTTTAPRVTTPPVTSPPTTVAPAPTPTTLLATVELSPADKQLHDGGKNDQQEQQSKSNGRCRSHAKNLQAIVR
jgi:hypothetical protein